MAIELKLGRRETDDNSNARGRSLERHAATVLRHVANHALNDFLPAPFEARPLLGHLTRSAGQV